MMTRCILPARMAAALVVIAFAAPRLAAADPAPAPATCATAATAAEARYDLPAGLLQAIGQVESGRRDPATSQLAPWPFTIDAQGRGQQFESLADAVAATRALQRSGIQSIDVGCFQVNLAYHPDAFAALEDGFDPDRNADYAARFLTALHARTGGWDEAVAAYHSATPGRGGPYRDRVLAAWSNTGPGTSPPGTSPPDTSPPGTSPPGSRRPAAPPPQPIRIRMVTWSPGTGAMHVWSPSAPGQGASIIRIVAPHPSAPAHRIPRG